MDRRTFAVDRAVTVVVALVLVLGGAWVFAWTLDLLPQSWWSPTAFSLGLTLSVTDAPLWPWALGVGGILLALLALVWFGSHFRSSGIGDLSLRGDARGGRLLLQSGALASAAAAALTESSPAVTGAGGKVVDEGRRLVLALTATVRPDADLREIARACDAVAAQALRSTGREDLECRIRVKVAPAGRSEPRVR
ncbi:hypothetical protein KZX45_09185 [Georgenia sp. EYE_87]|uniref:hypothetical protein n=1 Tax=Georgenia sp. EYE_87 TaxID=2853448 RepID=UPI002004AB3E|nr:hypothetical protein [Georgenia sp. EYE_87]MCK6210712.1 hypothetical protein [Georgenia sp. EYE_87]